jgi:hypothetical protein
MRYLLLGKSQISHHTANEVLYLLRHLYALLCIESLQGHTLHKS